LGVVGDAADWCCGILDDGAMNPGLSEEVGKAATATVSALSSTPAVLALVVFNVMFMILMAYVAIKSGERWDREVQRWSDLVGHCTLKAE
jgi:hypothetical protein